MNISFEDFKKCEMRMGKVLVAENVEGSEKLLRLEVDFGPSASSRQVPSASSGQVPSEEDSDTQEIRQILSGIAKWYKPEYLIGKQLPFIVNLEPRKMMGLESQGMLIATNDENGAVLLLPNREVPAGSSLM